MSFRGRLRVFFTIIVIVPMIAVAVVLFSLSSQSETGKADAEVAAGLRNAIAVYRSDSDAAAGALRRVARDPGLGAAIASGNGAPVQVRLVQIARADRHVVSIQLYGRGGRLTNVAGDPSGVAPKSSPLRSGAGSAGILSVSVTRARDYVLAVRRLSGLEVAAARGNGSFATTKAGLTPARLGGIEQSGDVKLDGDTYRGRAQELSGGPGEPLRVAVFQSSTSLEHSVSDNRRVIFTILAAFFLLAL